MTDLPSQPKVIASSLRDIYAYILGDTWGRKIPPTFVVLGGELILTDLAQGRGNPLEMNNQDDEQDAQKKPPILFWLGAGGVPAGQSSISGAI